MTNEAVVWEYLIDKDKIGNPYAVAGIMGNLYAESRFTADNLQDSGNRQLGLTDRMYTSRVDSGDISMNEFIRDGYGYGIAQWTSRRRKQDLYKFWKDYQRQAGHEDCSIGDICMQTEFLLKELISKYPKVYVALRFAKTVREASDIFLKKFECPKDTGDGVQKKRAAYGVIYFEKFTGIINSSKKYIRVNRKSIQVRLGPGVQYASLGQALRDEKFELIDQDKKTGWYKVMWYDTYHECYKPAWITNKYTTICEE